MIPKVTISILFIIFFLIGMDALKCYNPFHEEVVCKPGEYCIKGYNGIIDEDLITSDGCGQCPSRGAPHCKKCETDLCNNGTQKVLKCYNDFSKEKECRPREKCITNFNEFTGEEHRGCGNCSAQIPDNPDFFDFICEECDSHFCNVLLPKRKCYNMANELEECKSGLQKCITRMLWESDGIRHIDEKGCGTCELLTSEGIELKPNCVECEVDRDAWNKEPEVPNIQCRTDRHPEGKLCQPGKNCILIRQGEVNVSFDCGWCPNDEDETFAGMICNECNTKMCNDIKFPKCWAGAGNAAGDFFVKKECKEFLRGPKDMKLLATCIKQQVEGLTYKDCGSCGSFVHDVNLSKEFIPGGKDRLDIRKCHECETFGDELCNNAFANRPPFMVYWLFVMINMSIMLFSMGQF